MAQISNFKDYQRGRRQATVDTDFSKGMYYTSGPIVEGYVKELVNFDLASNKTSLTSRPGLRTGEIIKCQNNEDIVDPADPLTGYYSEDTQIYDAQDCIENGEEFRQIILGNAVANKIWVLTVDKAVHTTEYIIPESLLDIDDASTPAEVYEASVAAIQQYEMNTENYVPPLSFDSFSMDFSESVDSEEAGEDCIFKNVPLTKMHDLVLSSGAVHGSIVGTFGFNNNYYFLSPSTNGSILYRTVFDTEERKYKFEVVTCKSITASEAVSFGYNMLDNNPYVFDDHVGGSSIFQMQGILPYDGSRANNGQLMMTPKKNQDVWFRCNYDVPSTESRYKVVWEWKELSADSWIQLSSQDITFTDTPVLEVPFKSPSENIMVRVSVYKYGNLTPDAFDDVVETAMTVGFDFTVDEHGSVNNLKQENYDLSHASGMFYWKNRIVLFGVIEDPTILFISDLNEPAYFPYPNNITVFDQPVVAVKELMDNLIVFTTDKIYAVKLAEDGNSWITTIIQSNLRIDPSDRHMILTVRNMLFFKSGDYYYMVVPKAVSTTGELTLAPISTPMMDFFKDFKHSIEDLLYSVFSYNDDFRLVDYYNFLDYEDVHNVYVFRMLGHGTQTEEDYGYFHVDLIYSTMDRTWKIYTYQTAHKIFPYQYDASRSGLFAFTDTFIDDDKVYRNIQLLKFDSQNCKDFYVPGENVADVINDPITTLRELAISNSEPYYFKNYQYIDTGYRNDNFHINKRYRELQLQINNIDLRQLEFGMEFLIDGDRRMTFVEYNTEQVIDETNDLYGMVYIEPVPIMNIPVDELNIIPDEIAFRANHWTLDESLFPEVNLWKIRVSVSGKGRAPRMKFVSYNEAHFEIISCNWVYRMMYMR